MNRVSYNYHIRTHNAADRRFICPECLKPFFTNAKLFIASRYFNKFSVLTRFYE
jgi:hypothetical protein